MIGRRSLRNTGRTIALVAVAAMTLSTVAPTGAFAASVGKSPTQATASHGTSDATEFSSARRTRHYHRRGGGGNAAGLAAFGAIVGTIGAIAASQSRRDYYYDRPGYYYDRGPGPGYYGPAQGYYSPSYY